MMSEIWAPCCCDDSDCPPGACGCGCCRMSLNRCGALVGVDVVYRCGWTPRGKINLPSIHRHD